MHYVFNMQLKDGSIHEYETDGGLNLYGGGNEYVIVCTDGGYVYAHSVTSAARARELALNKMASVAGKLQSLVRKLSS